MEALLSKSGKSGGRKVAFIGLFQVQWGQDTIIDYLWGQLSQIVT
jgi:hypothetical protein